MIISTLIHKYIMMTEHHTQKSQRNNKNMNIMDAENDKFSVSVYDKLYSVSRVTDGNTLVRPHFCYVAGFSVIPRVLGFLVLWFWS